MTRFPQCLRDVAHQMHSGLVRPIPAASGIFQDRNGARMALGSSLYVRMHSKGWLLPRPQ
jgi:hypothetical protein